MNWGDWVSSNPKVYRVAKKEASVTSNPSLKVSESSTSSQDINITERKPLINADNSVKNGTFVGEKSVLDIFNDDAFSDAAYDEIERLWPEMVDKTVAEIVEFLNKKGKVTTGIKDIQTWIDTLKC